MKDVRVRFAPSPTGYLHVGGARTALFNYLFARHNGGSFIIRIEDTDLERSTGEYEEMLLEDLGWLGLDWDEGPGKGGAFGPYRQSERNDIYRRYVGKLIEEGHAFPCFCTDGELDLRREEMKKAGKPPQYDGACRELGPLERQKKRDEGRPESVRFRIPDREVRIDDFARGEVVFPRRMVGDFVILRSNGLPTYNFAAAVDDALMKITHVIRGGEHLSNTLRQVLIYEALGNEMPRFAHIPLIHGEDGTKLSKRHGAPNIKDYREKGYPSEALVNYLAFLGWSTKGESEILQVEDLVKEFELERVSDSPSIFDMAKLSWVSANHIRAGGSARYLERALEYFPAAFRENYDADQIKEIFDLISENLPCFSMIEKEAASFTPGLPELSGEAREVLAGTGELLSIFADTFRTVENWDRGGIKEAIKKAGKQSGARGKGLYMPLRAAVTGVLHGPDLSSVLFIRGRDNVVEAVEEAARIF